MQIPEHHPSRPRSTTAGIALRGLANACLLAAGLAMAQGEPVTRALTELDERYMTLQRERVDELSRRYLGRQCCRGEDDLPLLQRLIDEGHVTASQRLELQAMGIVLGDILARELDLDWVIYEDDAGRSRALRIDETENYLFPATMIARRVEAGNTQQVSEIYQRARELVVRSRPPLPFQ